MYSKIIAIARKYTNSNTLAEDLAHDAILKALQNQDKFEKGSNLHAWLYTIVRNTFITQYNKTQKGREYAMIDDYMIDRGLSSHIAHNEGASNYEIELIRKELASLPDELRSIISDRSIGYTYQEIADKYQMPIGTIKNKIHIARKSLAGIDFNKIIDRRKSKSTIN